MYEVIEPDVKIGENVSIGHHVTLKNGTTIGDNVKLADYVKTTGLCYIGNNVNIRTDACISKGVIVEDWAFIGPGVMTNHTKFVTHGRDIPGEQFITRIGYGAIIGTNTTILSGVVITDNVITGANTLVTKSILEPGIYVGQPARFHREISEELVLPVPLNYYRTMFPPDKVEKYLPKCKNKYIRIR